MFSKELAGHTLRYSNPDTEEAVLEHFSDVISYDYSLLKLLDAKGVDVGSLKKHLDDILHQDGVQCGSSSK